MLIPLCLKNVAAEAFKVPPCVISLGAPTLFLKVLNSDGVRSGETKRSITSAQANVPTLEGGILITQARFELLRQLTSVNSCFKNQTPIY